MGIKEKALKVWGIVKPIAKVALETVLGLEIPEGKKFIYKNLDQAGGYALQEAEKLVDKAVETPEKYDDIVVIASLDCIEKTGEMLVKGAQELKAKFKK